MLPKTGVILEVASGSGEHIVHFAEKHPTLIWQPSDPSREACASIHTWSKDSGLPNIKSPLQIDAMTSDWSIDAVAAILCINMAHISPWEATIGLFAQASKLLPKDGALFLYGPYLRSDIKTALSNVQFDQSLRSRDPRWGIRSLDDIDALAQSHGFRRDFLKEMPANNLSLIFRPI